MKDYPGEVYEAAARPAVATVHAVEYCLQRLYADPIHVLEDEVAPGLSYRELIAALILSKDVVAAPSTDEDGAEMDADDDID